MIGVVYNYTKKVLEKVQREIPKCKANSTLIKVKGFCINRADILETKGKYKGVEKADILGIEFLGEKMNDESHNKILYGGLVSHGGYSNILTVNKSHLIPLPFEMDLSEKIAIPEAFLTAF